MMEIISYILLGFCLLQLLVAGINVLYRKQLKPPHPSEKEEKVSVLIPARNEAKNIGNLLSDLIKLPYKELEIWVYDDCSSDETTTVVKEYAAQDIRIHLLKGDLLPEAWLGKPHACHKLAQQASGDYLLFLDADVRIKGTLINELIHYTKVNKLGLLSLFPQQDLYSKGEKAVIPLMNYILLSLLPLPLVSRSRFASLSAANGQCMLFTKSTYQKYWPHRQMKKQKAEDIAIARFLKKQNVRIACLCAQNNLSCRMYHSYSEAINGFAKNIPTFFGNSYSLAFLFWLISCIAILPIALTLPPFFIGLYVAAYILTRIFVSIASRQNSIQNIQYLILQQINLGIILFTSLRNKRNKQQLWKERNISD